MSSLAPILRRRVQGQKTYSWRICPYASNDVSGRIPDIERADHPVTSGNMSLDSRGGHDNTGFVCLDPQCPFYLGTATTEIQMEVRVQKIDDQGRYTVETQLFPIPICSGTHFFEK